MTMLWLLETLLLFVVLTQSHCDSQVYDWGLVLGYEYVLFAQSWK